MHQIGEHTTSSNSYSDNPWVTVRLRLRLRLESACLWMEFTGFRRLVTWQMINQIDKPGSPEQLKQWLVTEMEANSHRQRSIKS